MQGQFKLEDPRPDLESSYRSYAAELVGRGEPRVPFTLDFEAGDFAGLIKNLSGCARGIGVPEGFVPHSTFWLVRDCSEIVGVSNLRHTLNPKLLREGGHIGYGIRPSARSQGLGTEILRQTLLRAAGLGLQRALITCGKPNLHSSKVILNNGGILDSEEFLAERGEVVQRYWVETPSALTNAVQAGIRRLEDVASGRVLGLSDEEYRAAVQQE